MIKLIIGKKGTGKTKRLIDMANDHLATAKGHIVFVDDDNKYMYDVNRAIRFVNAKEFGIETENMLYGLVAGMIAQDFDIETIYIDAITKITKLKAFEMESMLKKLERLTNDNNCSAVINMSTDADELPEFLSKYAI